MDADPCQGKNSKFFFCFPSLSSKRAMHNNVLSAKKFVLICKSTEIRPLTKQQWGSVSSNLHFSAGKQGVRLFDINRNPTLYLYCHFMAAMVITFLLVFSFSGHLLDFSMVFARGNNYRRRIDPITYTLSNSSRCRLTQSCLCYRSRLAPKQKYSMTLKNVELRFI